jgi:hypothetical protein
MIVIYLLALLFLGIYSYSQIDLNLTLLQFPWFMEFQKAMIQLGYYSRNCSSQIFLGLIIILTGGYLFILSKVKDFSTKHLAVILAAISIIGLFSYSAFSHDIYNYIFDARILAYHGANPYTTTALMFPADEWTRFMNWTHRTYPYGPAFLPITLIPYFLGLNKLVLTLFWFKTMFVGFYLGCVYFLSKIGGPKSAVFFALNPLILIEGIVSPHLDLVMLFFGLWSFYLLIQKKRIFSLAILVISMGIKYITGLFLPVFLLKRFAPEKRLNIIIILGFAGVVLQVFSRELLPHYFLVPLGFMALVSRNKAAWLLSGVFSASLLILRYYPFLSTGLWLPIKFFP